MKSLTDDYMKPQEVAKLLGVSRATVYRWFWGGRLNGLKLGAGLRISRASVTKMVEEGEVNDQTKQPHHLSTGP